MLRPGECSVSNRLKLTLLLRDSFRCRGALCILIKFTLNGLSCEKIIDSGYRRVNPLIMMDCVSRHFTRGALDGIFL
jgi:hypothetical protein